MRGHHSEESRKRGEDARHVVVSIVCADLQSASVHMNTSNGVHAALLALLTLAAR
jgi:hypothetical protein